MLNDHAGWIIQDAHIAFGGVAPKTIMAPKTEAALKGQPLSDATLKAALAAVREDVFVTPGAPGATQTLYHFLSVLRLQPFRGSSF